jgi:hypothetical protein
MLKYPVSLNIKNFANILSVGTILNDEKSFIIL